MPLLTGLMLNLGELRRSGRTHPAIIRLYRSAVPQSWSNPAAPALGVRTAWIAHSSSRHGSLGHQICYSRQHDTHQSKHREVVAVVQIGTKFLRLNSPPICSSTLPRRPSKLLYHIRLGHRTNASVVKQHHAIASTVPTLSDQTWAAGEPFRTGWSTTPEEQ